MKNSKKRELFTVLMLMLLSLALMALIIADEAGSVPIPLDVLFVNIFLAFVGEIVIAAFTNCSLSPSILLADALSQQIGFGY